MYHKLSAAPIGKVISSWPLVEWSTFMIGWPLLIGGLVLFSGYFTRLAAGILLALLIPITITAQAGSIDLMGPFMKNIAIMGGLIFFVMNDFRMQKLL